MAAGTEAARVVIARCAEIKIGDRHRKDMGDLESLAASIEDVGLLQPIGITEKKELVFGERRLRAIREILKQSEIPARVVSVPSILHGEYHENEIRKDFTVSERVAIAAALKEEIRAKVGERRGGNHESKAQKFGECPELDGKETAEVIAEKAGFGNPETFRQAEKVVLKGHADLVKAMDDGTVSVSAAAKIAELPKSEQKQVVSEKLNGTESPKPRKRKNSRHNLTKPTSCTEILALIDEAGDTITAARQKIEATNGQFQSHRFDMNEQVKRLSMARKLISQVRMSVKGE